MIFLLPGSGINGFNKARNTADLFAAIPNIPACLIATGAWFTLAGFVRMQWIPFHW